MKSNSNLLNLIYVCTAEKGPSGGAKIIYNHSSHINKLKISNVTSQILHIKKKKTTKWNTSLKKIFKSKDPDYKGWKADDMEVKKNFKSKWFKNKIILKNDFNFDKKKDFLIFPEIFAHFAKKLCADKNIPYAIFALNGYTLEPTNNYRALEESYTKAKLILSVSRDISKCLKISFPGCGKKILNASFAINSNKLSTKGKKKNLILYMSRKLPQHSELVMFFLRKHLPKNWKIKKLHNLNEKAVFRHLSNSKIFLSFTHFEGLGMPPIEAAITNNKVIGYTGEGGKEIWKEPIFTEIENGNILNFVEEILKNCIKKYNESARKSQKKILMNKFSLDQEKKFLIKFINLSSRLK